MKRSRASQPFDERLLAAYLIALLIGMVMIYSASSILAASRFGSHWHFLKQQVIWAMLSVAVIWVISRLDLQKLAIYSVPALMVTFLLLAMVFYMPARNGAHRWLFLGPFSFQPSELFKLLLVVYLSFSLANPRRNLNRLSELLWPYALIIGLGLAMIVAEPDLGTVIVIVLTVIGMFFLAGAKVKHLATLGAPIVAGGCFLVFGLGYKLSRVQSYVDALIDPLTGSYQVKQAALTLGSGGLFGTGLGDGRQKLFFLPYPHTDFIFASMGEEIGFVGLMVVLSLLGYILWRGCRIAARQPDKFGYLLAAGVTWSLFTNIAINVGVVTALLPVTGLALPFFSYGGTSLLVSSAAIGILVNLSRRVQQ